MHCVGPESESAGSAPTCEGCPSQSQCSSGAFRKDKEEDKLLNQRLRSIKHIVLILSGKGGVGKSTVTKELGFAFGRMGLNVGLLDTDICGPSLPRMTGCENDEVYRSNEGWEPVAINDNVVVMSTRLLLKDNQDAVIWRGPKKNSLIRNFLAEVNWGNLDILLVDTPPGTSDEHISIVSMLKEISSVSGALIVTTPQVLSIVDVRREMAFCEKVKLPILGVIENMTSFHCPNCGKESSILPRPTTDQSVDCTNVTSQQSENTIQSLVNEFGTKLIGSIPLEYEMMRASERGMSMGDFVRESTDVADKTSHRSVETQKYIDEMAKSVLADIETLEQ